MFKRKLMLGCAATALAIAVVGFSAAHAQGLDEKYAFEIKAQTLEEALIVFSKQSGVQVIASGDMLANKKIVAYKKHQSAQAALNEILKGTNLTYKIQGKATVLIVDKSQKGGFQKISANAGMGFQANSSGNEAAVATEDADNMARVSGHVTELNTGSNLAGALVKIVETGQVTKTDDLGNFTFPSVSSGDYTLSISYLGFASLITDLSLGRGEEFHNEFSMGKSLGELDEIVVFGSRSARALALNLQRTAENNSDIISADMLGNFTGTTISEALRRVSGVAFQRDPLTGDGTNIFIRGHSPDMSAIKLNGLHLPVGSGTGRAPDLSTILADSISKITIHKSLLPSHDSTGTGGGLWKLKPRHRSTAHTVISI